jgi:hypothetical protein
VYRSDTADFPTPAAVAMEPTAVPRGAHHVDDEESVEALVDLGRVWSAHSNGSVSAVAVEGGPGDAIGALDPGPVAAGPADAADALAWMVWAGASGGAYGRRRGTPAGRFAAWWAMAALTGLEWPPDPGDLWTAAAGLEWLLWEPRDTAAGWRLGVAAAHPGEGIAWAVWAEDSHREDDVLAEG